MRGRWVRSWLAVSFAFGALALSAPVAGAAEEVRELSLRASDGVTLHATVAGQAPLTRRPLVVEYSPYGQGPDAHPPLGPEFNYVYVHARGTGRSGGAWDIMGAREQQDIAENTTTLPSTARSSEAVPSTCRASCRIWSEAPVSARPGIDTSGGIA